jgi:hypothetical protein
MLRGFASITAASAASSAVFGLTAFPFMVCSAFTALMGTGATAPRAMLAFLQIPPSRAMTDAMLAMAKTIGFCLVMTESGDISSK